MSDYPRDPMLSIAQGRVYNHNPEDVFGRAPSGVQATATTIWDRADATPTQQVWVAPTAPRIHSLVSTDADDTDGGTGARKVRIWGIESWTDIPSKHQTTEDIVMAGATPVNTVNSYVMINKMRVIEAGSSTTNEGVITATAATDNTVTSAMLAGNSTSLQAIYGVPNGWQAWVQHLSIQVLQAQGTPTTVQYTLWDVDYSNASLPVKTIREIQGVQSTGASHHNDVYEVPLRFTGPCLILVEGLASAPDVDGACSVGLVVTPKYVTSDTS